MLKRTLLFTAAMITGAFVKAAEPIAYVNVGYGLKTELNLLGLDISQINNLVDTNLQSWKISGGYFVLPTLSVDAQYSHFGKVSLNKVLPGISSTPVTYQTTPSSFGVSGTFHFPVSGDFLNPYAKVGAHYWSRKDETALGGTTPSDRTGTDIMYGLGVNLQLMPGLYLGVEYEHLDMSDASTTQMLLGVSYRL